MPGVVSMWTKGPQAWIIATGTLAMCAGLIFMYQYEFHFQPDSRVWGQVTFNGRAMRRGAIAFTAFGYDPRAWISAPLDEQGRYSVNLWRIENKPGHMRALVAIVPYKWRPRPFAEGEGASAVIGGGGSNEVSGPRSPLAGATDERTAGKIDGWFPEKLTHPKTSGLEVVLTRQPTRIDFHLESSPSPAAPLPSPASNSNAAPRRANAARERSPSPERGPGRNSTQPGPAPK